MSATTTFLFLAGVCGLVSSLPSIPSEYYTSTADYDSWVAQWVSQKGINVGRKVSWWDMYLRHSHLIQRPQYHQYRISVGTESVQYGKPLSTIDQPSTVYTQWFHNSQATEKQNIQITRQVQRKKHFQWRVQSSIKIDIEAKASANIPLILDASASFSTKIDLKADVSDTREESETFTIDQKIVIPPKTSLKAEWIITDKSMDIPWTANAYIKGWVAVWFEQKYNDHWLWFYPAHYLSNNTFKKHGNDLKFTCNGIFTGTLGKESVLKVEEYPLHYDANSDGQPIKTTYYKFPVHR